MSLLLATHVPDSASSGQVLRGSSQSGKSSKRVSGAPGRGRPGGRRTWSPPSSSSLTGLAYSELRCRAPARQPEDSSPECLGFICLIRLWVSPSDLRWAPVSLPRRSGCSTSPEFTPNRANCHAGRTWRRDLGRHGALPPLEACQHIGRVRTRLGQLSEKVTCPCAD